MHPEILRELIAQHGRDLREQAHKAAMARTASRAMRALRRGARPAGADEFAVPAIPDYVDGSFRTAGDAADTAADRVPAARHAA